MAGDEGRHSGRRGGLADAVGNVDGEEITRVEKPLNRADADMIGIDKPGVGPVPRGHGCRGRLPHTRRLAADEGMFPVRLVPHRCHHHPLGGEAFKGGQLGLGLMGEAIPHADRKPGQGMARGGPGGIAAS